MTLSTLDRPETELEDVILAYLTAVDAGEAPGREELMNRHPQFASELADFFADQDQTASGVAPLRNVGPAGPALLQHSSFGDYEVFEEIARGGMGVVFRARQVSLNRPVALKMILAGHLASPMDVQRFQAEAEMGAHLEHPHIVPIYEVGEHRGQHYFSMKLMEGGSLAKEISDGRWKMADPERQRRAAHLIATIARAVEHAHQRGLLHRDLKPGNILFDLEERAHVSDFGLSKRVQPAAEGEQARGADLTVSGTVVGTPSYMAPEQAMAQRTVTTAADVYSLGAILYELLGGKAPFQAATALETLRQVTSTEPPRPRGLNPRIDRDLETITMKCLAKEPRSRYVSAAALAEDLERWLAAEPIRARPAGPVERAAKWARRRPASAALCGLLAMLSLLGLAALIWSWQAAEAAQLQEKIRGDREAQDKHRLAVQLYFKNIALARLEFADNNLGRANELLKECDPALRGWEWHFLDRYFNPDATTLRQHTAGVVSLAFSAASDRLVSVSSPMLNRPIYERLSATGRRRPTTNGFQGKAGAIRIFRTADGSELLRIDPKADLIFCVASSPDGKSVACSGDTLSGTGFIKVFDTVSGKELFSITGIRDAVRSVAYSPDGQRLASAGDDGMVQLWDAMSGKLIRKIADRDSSIRAVSAVAFSPDGKRLAGAIGEATTVRIWDTATGRQLWELQGHTANVTRLAYSPDGHRLATASEDHTVKIWNTDTGSELITLVGHLDGVAGVAFSPNGERLVSSSYDNTVRVWDSGSGLLCCTLAGHGAAVVYVAWSPDGQRLASASLDDTIKLWNASGGQAARALRPADMPMRGLVFSPDGRHLAGGCGRRPGAVVVLDVVAGKEARAFQGHEKQIGAVAYAPDGMRLASLSLDNTVRIWDTATGKAIHTLQLAAGPSRVVDLRGVAYSADGKRLAATAPNEPVKVWDAATGKELHDFHDSASTVAFSPDARRLASAGREALKVRDADTGKEIYAVNGSFEVVLFTPDGSRLVALGSDGIKFLDAATGKEVLALRPRSGQRGDLAAISPDGRRLALVDGRNVIRLWDTSSGEEALALPGHADTVVGLAFSPDGQRLASADFDGVMHFWDATPRR
jgi:WD40 repeat protein/tRNA A-37 threonylcarbamoyl transferase component Bud32